LILKLKKENTFENDKFDDNYHINLFLKIKVKRFEHFKLHSII